MIYFSSVKFSLRLFFVTLISVLLLTLLSVSSARADEKEAKNYVNDIAHRATAIIKRTDISEDMKEKKLTSMFLSNVDTKFIGKFSLGKYWRGLKTSQQKEYLDIYSKYLVGLYVPKFRQYTGDAIRVTDAKEIRPNEYLVQTQIGSGNSLNIIKINYSVQQDPKGLEKFIIFDIIAEGVSLIITQRAEVNSIMADGSFSDLMGLLKSKTGKRST